MTFIKHRLADDNSGQGLVEYMFIVMLVTLVFWLGVKDTNVGQLLAASWGKVTSCVAAPFDCVS